MAEMTPSTPAPAQKCPNCGRTDLRTDRKGRLFEHYAPGTAPHPALAGFDAGIPTCGGSYRKPVPADGREEALPDSETKKESEASWAAVEAEAPTGAEPVVIEDCRAETDGGELHYYYPHACVTFQTGTKFILHSDHLRAREQDKSNADQAEVTIALLRVKAEQDRERIAALEKALKPFADFVKRLPKMDENHPLTQGSRLAHRQVTYGDFMRALSALTHTAKGAGE